MRKSAKPLGRPVKYKPLKKTSATSKKGGYKPLKKTSATS